MIHSSLSIPTGCVFPNLIGNVCCLRKIKLTQKSDDQKLIKRSNTLNNGNLLITATVFIIAAVLTLLLCVGF